MAADSLRSWLQYLPMPWWLFGVAYAAFDVLVNVLLCALFGGRARLRQYASDPIGILWSFLVPGPIALIYVANWTALAAAITVLADNGIDMLMYRLPVLRYTGNWVQWLALALAVANATISFRRYRFQRTDRTWFTSPWIFHVVRTCLFDIPLGYMMIMTLITFIDSTVAFNSAFLQHSQTLDIWHPDGLYGLDPAHKLLLGQFTVVLAISFLPLVILSREADQQYARMYKALVLAGVLATIVLGGVTLWSFNHAVKQARLAAITSVVDELHNLPTQPGTVFEAQCQIGTLLKYQNTVDLLESVPIPGWLALLGTSRMLLIAVELYSLLQPVLKMPSVPTFVRKLLKR